MGSDGSMESITAVNLSIFAVSWKQGSIGYWSNLNGGPHRPVRYGFKSTGDRHSHRDISFPMSREHSSRPA